MLLPVNTSRLSECVSLFQCSLEAKTAPCVIKYKANSSQIHLREFVWGACIGTVWLRFYVSVNTIAFALVRNSDRLGNGVLYASVNPEYFSAAESKLRSALFC